MNLVKRELMSARGVERSEVLSSSSSAKEE